jgi:hypothetical protein
MALERSMKKIVWRPFSDFFPKTIMDRRTLLGLAFRVGLLLAWPRDTFAEDQKAISGETVRLAEHPEDHYWWCRFPTFTQGDFKLLRDARARMDIFSMASDPTWGPLGQRLTEIEDRSGFDSLRKAGARVITYIEGFGDCMIYVAALNRLKNGGFERNSADPQLPLLLRTAWNWNAPTLPKGNEIRWVGIHNTVNDEDFILPYLSAKRLGLPAPRYPDGRSAAGWLSGKRYPLNAMIYDACGSKDVNGVLRPQFSPCINAVSTDGLYPADPKTDDVDGYSANIGAGTVYCGIISVHKDLSAPFWREYAKESLREIVKARVDGVWCDNYSPWDNFGYPPVEKAFGEWSVHRFHQSFHSPQSDFDVRKSLKRTAVRFGAKNASKYDDPAWRDMRWRDDIVWNAFKAFRQMAARQDLKEFYDNIHAVATEQGRPDFCIQGNDIPLYGLGWTRDSWLDMVNCELTPGWHMGTGSRGITLPPHGKMTVVYRAALEHQKGVFSSAWYYLNGDAAKHRNSSPLARTLLSEAFANGALLLCQPDNSNNVAGSAEDHAWWNEFLRINEEQFGIRVPWADAAILFSPDNQLFEMAPGGFPDLDRQPHIFGHWGWGTMMTDAHLPYRVLPDWKLDASHLSEFQTLIVPDAVCLEDAACEAILQWIKSGGNLVATGMVGSRHGPERNFAPRRISPLQSMFKGNMRSGFSKLGKGSVCWSPDPLGMNYYLDIPGRPEMLGKMLQMLPEKRILEASSAPVDVGIFLWRSRDGGNLFIDMVNFNVDLEREVMIPLTNIEIYLPSVPTEGAKITTLSPDGTPPVVMSSVNGKMKISAPQLLHYACVKIDRKHT